MIDPLSIHKMGQNHILVTLNYPRPETKLGRFKPFVPLFQETSDLRTSWSLAGSLIKPIFKPPRKFMINDSIRSLEETVFSALRCLRTFPGARMETCVRACVRLPEERWLGHGQGDALFPQKRGERLYVGSTPLLLLLRLVGSRWKSPLG